MIAAKASQLKENAKLAVMHTWLNHNYFELYLDIT